MGWPDHCASFTWDVLANADELLGQDVNGFSVLENCHFSIAVEATIDRGRFCDVFVHERLHLVRQDGWHDPMPNSPLYYENDGYAPCHPVPTPAAADVDWLTRRQVHSLLERKLGHRWRVKVLVYSVSEFDMDAIVRARR